MRRSSNAAFQIMRSMHKTASRDPAADRLSRGRQPAGAARGPADPRRGHRSPGAARPARRDRGAVPRGLARHPRPRRTVIDPNEPASAAAAERYALRLTELRGRKGVTLAQARSLLRQSNYYGVMMLEGGDVDGLVGGFKRSYPDSVRPSLQVLGLAPGAQVAVGMYMMMLAELGEVLRRHRLHRRADRRAARRHRRADGRRGRRPGHHAAGRDDLVLELRLDPSPRRRPGPAGAGAGARGAGPTSRSTARCSPRWPSTRPAAARPTRSRP
jgi:hypothetical protein